MPIAGLGRESRHGRADEIGQTLGVLGVTGGDVVTNYVLCGDITGTRRLARLAIVAAGSFQHQAAGSGGIGGVPPGSLLQHGCERLGHRTVRAQDVCEGNGPGVGPAIENAAVETSLVAEGGVEAGRVDASASVTSATLTPHSVSKRVSGMRRNAVRVLDRTGV